MPLRATRLLTMLALGLAVGLGSAEEPRHQPKAAAKPKVNQAPKRKLVDLNSASKERLKKLPGITDELADRIMAGRPYLSKAHLVTHRILPAELYGGLKDRVAALQPRTAKF